jgi:membrane-associated phospholipid phosphatase
VGPNEVPANAPPATLSVQTAQELASLHQWQLNRTSDQVLHAQATDGPATQYWEQLMLNLIVVHSNKNGLKNPPQLSRQIAMLADAMYDAEIVAWAEKYCYQRPAPSMIDPALQPVVSVPAEPSYPSEHAAAAGAAAALLAVFFPCPDANGKCEEPPGRFDREAYNVSENRVIGGANYQSDVDEGLRIGYAVGNAVLAARAGDGYNAVWDGSGRITGPCNWIPTPPAFQYPPVQPLWGQVTPFVLASGSELRPGPPPACGSLDYTEEAQDLYDTSLNLTPREIEIALYWNAGQGTQTPPGMNYNIAINETVAHGLDTIHHARVMSYEASADADAAIAAWDAKFTYWWIRPVTEIREASWGDPNWSSLIPTPPFPGYISGHATFTAAGTSTLAHFFPQDAQTLSALATEAANSRMYGGIHVRSDNEMGLQVGSEIGQVAGALSDTDGAS